MWGKSKCTLPGMFQSDSLRVHDAFLRSSVYSTCWTTLILADGASYFFQGESAACPVLGTTHSNCELECPPNGTAVCRKMGELMIVALLQLEGGEHRWRNQLRTATAAVWSRDDTAYMQGNSDLVPELRWKEPYGTGTATATGTATGTGTGASKTIPPVRTAGRWLTLLVGGWYDKSLPLFRPLIYLEVPNGLVAVTDEGLPRVVFDFFQTCWLQTYCM